MKNRRRSNRNSGFTLVEVLATVAILVILLGVSAVSVVEHIDYLKLTELDNAAREIYMAAENRAVLLSNAKRLDHMVRNTCHGVKVDLSKSAPHGGSEAGASFLADIIDEDTQNLPAIKENLYYVHLSNAIDNGLLDDKSIDPALLEGDFYIVYSLYKDDEDEFIGSGGVTDVVFAEHEADLKDYVDDESDSDREDKEFADNYTSWWIKDHTTRVNEKRKNDSPLVGWYNGDAVKSGSFTPDTSEKPYLDVEIVNGEELTVTLTVKGTYVGYIDSGLKNLTVRLGPTGNDVVWTDENSIKLGFKDGTTPSGASFTYEWVLDSLTTGEPQFKDLVKIVKTEDGKEIVTGYKVTPGDDFKVVATITHEGKTYSAEDTDNSLFWKDEDVPYDSSKETAYIKYLRHLQNLSAAGGFDSGVNFVTGKEKIKAFQVDNILGDNNTTYPNYQFVPIVNDALLSYKVNTDGTTSDNYAIWNLTLKAENGASVGLFQQTKKAGMTLDGIRMVNTKVSAADAASVGALAGTAYDTAIIKNCWVYWDESRLPKGRLKGNAGVLSKNDTLQYQLKGATVGGLVGVVEKYEADSAAIAAENDPMFDHCLAATLIQGTSNAGGLMGRVAAGASVSISHSYADCYLTGSGNVAGLVGYLESNITLTDCYAAGFIMGAGKAGDKEQAAGLCLGGGTTTAKNVYSVMLRATPSGKTYDYNTPAVPLASRGSFGESSVYFLGEGQYGKQSEEMNYKNVDFLKSFATKDADDKDVNSFEWRKSETDTAAFALDPDPEPGFGREGEIAFMAAAVSMKTNVSYPYELLEDLEAYDYPGLVGLPHYGDWGELELNKVVGLVYYEQYGGNSWGIEGYNYDQKSITKTLDAETSVDIKRDGYALVVKKSYLEDAESVTVRLNSVDYIKNKPSEGWPEVTDVILEGSVEPVVYLIYLDDELVKPAAGVDGFYTSLSIELYRGKTATGSVYGGKGDYFFNPHFALTVRISKPTSVGNIIIRTPRHLYNLSKYDTYYHNTSKYTFEQQLDLALGSDAPNFYTTENSYTAIRPIGSYAEPKDGKKIDSTDTGNSFNGIYDGGNHSISGLSISSNTSGYQGLFGYNTGEIKNISNVTGSVSVTGSYENVGGIVGFNAGTVTGCNFNGTVSAKNSSSVGGIAGSNGGTVASCTNGNTISGSQNVGGIVGYNVTVKVETKDGEGKTITEYKTATVKSCTNDSGGNVTGNQYVGGIAGYNDSVEAGKDNKGNPIIFASTVTDCTNRANIQSNASWIDAYVGGIVGYNKGTVQNGCSNSGDVKGYQSVGGIVGYNDGTSATVAGCVNTGAVSAEYKLVSDVAKGYYAGGIVGYNNAGKVTLCTNSVEFDENGLYIIGSGRIEGQDYVGGLVGYNNNGTVQGGESSDNTGTVHATREVGGIVGYNIGANAKVLDCENEGVVTTYRYNNGNVIYDGKQVGGVAGSNISGTVSNCSNSGSVDADQILGGIVGLNDRGTVENCHNNSSDLTGGSGTNATDPVSLGGIVGSNSGGTVISCYNTVSLTYKGSRYGVGGIVGGSSVGSLGNGKDGDKKDDDKKDGDGQLGTGSAKIPSAIVFCYNAGGVFSNGDSVGGIVGDAYLTDVISCYNTGVVVPYSDTDGNGTLLPNPEHQHGDFIGGIVGQGGGTMAIVNCYNSYEVKEKDTVSYGGIMGGTEVTGNYITLKGCYYVGEKASGSSNGVTITETMKVTTGEQEDEKGETLKDDSGNAVYGEIENGDVAAYLNYWVQENWEGGLYKAKTDEEGNPEKDENGNEAVLTYKEYFDNKDHPKWGQKGLNTYGGHPVLCGTGDDGEDVKTSVEAKQPPETPEEPEKPNYETLYGTNPIDDYPYEWTVNTSKLYDYSSEEIFWLKIWNEKDFKAFKCTPDLGLSDFSFTKNFNSQDITILCFKTEEFELTITVALPDGNDLTIIIECPAKSTRSLNAPDSAAIDPTDTLPPELSDPDVPDQETAALPPEPETGPTIAPDGPEDDDSDGENPVQTPLKARVHIVRNVVKL